MTTMQIERLKQDSHELTSYANMLEKRGLLERMKKILEKRAFIDRKIAQTA